MLAAIVADELTSFAEPSSSIVLSIFYDYNDKEHHAQVSIVAAVLRQLVQLGVEIPRKLEELHQASEKRGQIPSRDFTETLKFMLRGSTVMIVIDGLDECSDRHECLSLVDELRAMRPKGDIRLIAMSRSIPEIQKHFQGCLFSEIHAHEADIAIMLESQIAGFSRQVTQSSDLQSLAMEKIIEAANGMFLLAWLHVQSLKGMKSAHKIRGALGTLSTSLPPAYKAAIERITGQSEHESSLAKRLIAWTVFACRPLTAREMQEALAVDLDEPNFHTDNITPIGGILSVSAGLAVVDSVTGTVRLVHTTAYEYFRLHHDLWNSWKDGPIAYLAKTCLVYLTFARTKETLESELKPASQRQVENTSETYATTAEIGSLGKISSNGFLASFPRRLPVYPPGTITSNLYRTLLKVLDFKTLQQAKALDLPNPYPLIQSVNSVIDYTPPRPLFHPFLHPASASPSFLGSRYEPWSGPRVSNSTFGDFTKQFPASLSHQLSAQFKEQEAPAFPIFVPSCYSVKNRQIPKSRLHKKLPLFCYAARNWSCHARNHQSTCATEAAAFLANNLLVEQSAWAWCYEEGRPMTIPYFWQWQSYSSAPFYAYYDKFVEAILIDLTGLHLCASLGLGDLTKVLIKGGFSQHARDSLGRTPLHFAALAHNDGLIRILADRDTVNIEDLQGFTALHLASRQGCPTCVRALLKAGANPEQRNGRGRTALQSACSGANISTARELIKNGAKLDARDYEGMSALYNACILWNGDPQIIDFLLQMRADINARDIDWRTPLHVACASDSGLLADMLLEAGADVNIVDYGHETPFLLSSRLGNEDMMRKLLDHGADVNICNVFGESSLHFVCRAGYLSTLRIPSFHADVNINQADHAGTTPLHLACLNGHDDLVEVLVALGADVNSYSLQFGLPTDAAMTGPATNSQVIQILINAGALPPLMVNSHFSGDSKYRSPSIPPEISMVINSYHFGDSEGELHLIERMSKRGRERDASEDAQSRVEYDGEDDNSSPDVSEYERETKRPRLVSMSPTSPKDKQGSSPSRLPLEPLSLFLLRADPPKASNPRIEIRDCESDTDVVIGASDRFEFNRRRHSMPRVPKIAKMKTGLRRKLPV
ncbi:MAG: hypothetical protein M1821_003774 [Bathelium mastoideum]|nr:MAG: hypothetical protein M1821_003774 [Bathelium mastoideum]